MKKIKYDYWSALSDVANFTFLGLLASMFLIIAMISLTALFAVLVLKTFGFIAVALVGVVISTSVLVILTVRRVKKKGNYYAKY